MSHPALTPGQSPRRRIVLLGASNLTRGISTAVQTARQIWPEPLEILIAAGHGRSYGMSSRVLTRQLPGILESGLWLALQRSTGLPTAALLTDIGNDLIYGSSVSVVLGWVEQCLDRLADAGADVILTGLPVAGLAERPRWQFELLHRVFFPERKLRISDVIRRAQQLDEKLAILAKARGLARIEPRQEWYGWDPIHIKLRHWPVAWREILAPWCRERDLPATAAGSLRRWAYLRMLRPEQRRLLGLSQQRIQPAGHFPDGTSIGIY